MAKPLNKKTSFSSLEHLLDHSIADSLLSRAEEIEPLPKAIEPIKVKEAIRKIEFDAPVKKKVEILESEVTKLQANEPTGELANITREVVLTPSTAKTLDELESILSTALGCELTRSHVARALFVAVKESLPRIATEAMKLGPMKRPSNAKGFEAERISLKLGWLG